MKPVLCISQERGDDGGLAIPALEAAGMPVLFRDAWKDESPWPALDDLCGVIAFGGSMNVDGTEAHPFLKVERDLVREVLGRGLPFLGICLGAQLLARACDEPVVPAPSRTLGFTAAYPTDAGRADVLASVFEEGAMTFHWHEDTFALPKGATLLVAGADGSVQVYRQGSAAWGVVFHPEVTGPELQTWFDSTGRGAIASTWGVHPDDLQPDIERHLPRHEARGRGLFERFARVLEAHAR
jgi:GMP synthase (glutamine-hydrolysing)